MNRLFDQNRVFVSKLDKTTLAEIKNVVKTNAGKFTTSCQMICLLFEPYDSKQSQLLSKAEFAHQTAKKIILVQPVQKLFAQFKTDSISKEQCEELVVLIEKSKITVNKVACVNKSMSLLTEWMLGVVDYRRTQLELEPII